MITVARLSVTAVKGTRLRCVERLELGPNGAAGDRRYFVIDERNRLLNSKLVGELQTVIAEALDGSLSLLFPDGAVASGEVVLGETVETRFFSELRPARVLEGPWAEAMSAHVGRAVRLVAPSAAAVDRGRSGGATLISSASLARLAQEAGSPEIDARRFRMLIEVDGVSAHEEDAWVGRSLRIGAAVVRFGGNVGRCLITSRDPDSGAVDLPTLDLLGAYRGDVNATEPLPFGIYGEVVAPGAVSVGDPVTPLQ